MEVRAALATGAGKPLSIETVQLEGPKCRRGVDRGQGHRRLPYRCLHPLGRGPRGAVPRHPRARGRRRCCGGRRRCGERGAGRSRDPPLRAGMPPVRLLPERQDQSLPVDPHDPGRRRHAGWVEPLLPRRRQDFSLHGHVDLRGIHGRLRIFGGKGSGRRALRQDLLHRLRRHHRRRRRHQHGEGATRATMSWSSA